LYRTIGTGPEGRNHYWELDSRNKRSLAVDLKRAEGREVLHRLIETADVFVTNLPPSARRRLRIDYESIAPLNPRLVYASFSAYGETGPEAEKSGFDVTAFWARSGLMDIVKPDHGAEPARSAAGMGDHPSAMALYGAIVTALYQRERTGRGGHVSSSLLGNGLWANGCLVQARLTGAQVPRRVPRAEAANPMINSYRCRDGRWLVLIVINEARQFVPLLEALGAARLADDPRFASAEARAANHRELIEILDAAFAQRDLADWRVRLDDAGVTFSLVSTLDEVLHDEQMRAAGALVRFAHRDGLTVASPIELDGVPKVPPGRAPEVGEHTTAVLRQAGFAEERIRELLAQGVVGARPAPP
jgi:formyl-CoA transferase